LISDSEEDSIKLTRLVTTCYEALNVYGKTPEQLEAIIAIFQMDLEDYEYAVVRQAFKIYRKTNSTMPTPADIIKIIDPPKEERKWCGATYIQLCKRKRENQFMLDRELKYIADFEKARTTAPEDQRGLIEEAISNNAIADNRYWLEN
jgi:hypothetical protein